MDLSVWIKRLAVVLCFCTLFSLFSCDFLNKTEKETEEATKSATECVTDEATQETKLETSAVVTEEAVTDAPSTDVPATDAPVTEAPATDAPTTDAPVTDVPVTDVPDTDAPDTDAPDTDAPATDAPETIAPETTAPETDAPVTDAPDTDSPTTDAPDTDAPDTDAPDTDAPDTDTPTTDAPDTDAPETTAPDTDAPVTDAPDTDAPETAQIDGVECVIDKESATATVKAEKGLVYTASGYSEIARDGFSFVSGLNIDLGDRITASFNRFTLKYRSSAPMKIFVSYTLDGANKEDYYFLEAGEGSFSGLIPDFLAGKQGSAIASIKLDTCENKNASFLLLGLETEIVSVPQRDYYFSGTRYTLGIDLGWGGTINYVSDVLCPVDGLENMINKHDTGRLVQQSYYGTGEKEGIDFEYGSFNGSDKWPYNPVQGGGQGNTASRLVDFVEGDGYVYIKVQPMDWGKSDIKYITPSYMENWYIIEDDYIKVDNRFVDFSGWEHGCKSQELPAFYTVSYLDSFVWYDGIKSWTGDDLTWRHELRFWGDSQYAGECSFRIKEGNSETWCAWISTEDNYGIGVYTPNIDRFSAGRYQYIETLGVSTGTLGSKDPAANPTNYVAPWKQIEFISYVPLEYSYIIAAGSVDEIRATFTENKDLIDNASLSENSINNRQPSTEKSILSIFSS